MADEKAATAAASRGVLSALSGDRGRKLL